MSVFKFKEFEVTQAVSAMKIGTDAMIFGALVSPNNKFSGLDIGTGTGVLSLMVAQHNPQIQIQAIEIEENAFLEASENFSKSKFSKRLKALHKDFLEFKSDTLFDLVFSNPPYFENSSKSASEQRNTARHDDGLPLDQLCSKVIDLLTADGDFWLILPYLTMQGFYLDAANKGLHLHIEINVFGKEGSPQVRTIAAFSKVEKPFQKSELVIRDQYNQYTTVYKILTEHFHFNQL